MLALFSAESPLKENQSDRLVEGLDLVGSWADQEKLTSAMGEKKKNLTTQRSVLQPDAGKQIHLLDSAPCIQLSDAQERGNSRLSLSPNFWRHHPQAPAFLRSYLCCTFSPKAFTVEYSIFSPLLFFWWATAFLKAE